MVILLIEKNIVNVQLSFGLLKICEELSSVLLVFSPSYLLITVCPSVVLLSFQVFIFTENKQFGVVQSFYYMYCMGATRQH